MRQATLGGVGICHAMQEKRNLLSYADFLLVTAVRTGQLTGPRYSPLASHTNFWKALTDSALHCRNWCLTSLVQVRNTQQGR